MDRGVDSEQGPDRSAPGANGRPPWFGSPPRLQDYLFLMRPMILIPVWTFYLLGAYHGMRGGESTIETKHLFLGFFSFTALMGAVYVINQIADRNVDRANRKLFLIPDAIISVRSAWIEAALLVAVSFQLGTYLPRPFMTVLVASLGLGALYSLDPFRLKKRAVLDVAANAAGNGILNTIAGWVAIGAPLDGWHALIPYPFAVASVHLTTTLADIEGDAASGFRTSGVLLGVRPGLRVAMALMAAAAVAAFAVGNRPALYASFLSLPLFLFTLRSTHGTWPPSRLLLPAKIATLAFSLISGFLFPLYIPFLALVILVTRSYYAGRFGMRYPSL
ncbi:MAG TPA: UbiA family prenyltransferase [Patescibacteria group bacterium]|nr:UbiA family prenyltransferase [Patescibacteria group bacterium]